MTDLREALNHWKCAGCGGSGKYQQDAKGRARAEARGKIPDPKFQPDPVTCKVCNGDGLNPIASAALREPRDDARGELYEALGAAMLAAGLHPNEAQTLAITDALRPAPVPQCEAEPDDDWTGLRADGDPIVSPPSRLDAESAENPHDLKCLVCGAVNPQPDRKCRAICFIRGIGLAALVPPPSEAGRLRKALEIARPYVERAYWKTSGDECSAEILKKELAQIDAALSRDPGTVAVASTDRGTPQ